MGDERKEAASAGAAEESGGTGPPENVGDEFGHAGDHHRLRSCHFSSALKETVGLILLEVLPLGDFCKCDIVF